MTLMVCDAASDGTTTHVFDCAASDLPSVRARDLGAAWEVAREAASLGILDQGRIFRFRRDGGGWTDLAVWDRDTACWIGAIDSAVGIQTSYGVSVCLRLLALINLLGRSPWASGLASFDRSIVRIDPTLLRLVAESPLTDEADFDEAMLRARLAALSPQPANKEVRE